VSTYTRRKRDAECYNPADYNAVVSVTPCSCKRIDYECDYCFDLDRNGNCTKVCSYYNPSSPPPDCFGSYEVTQGYRLVPGDQCDLNAPDALKLGPVLTKCPNDVTTSTPTSGQVSNGGGGSTAVPVLVGLLIVTLLLVGIVVGVYFVKKTQKPEPLYRMLSGLFQPKTGNQYGQLDFDEDGASPTVGEPMENKEDEA